MNLTVVGYLILISINFYNFIFLVSHLVSVWIEKLHQTLTKMFAHNSKHLNVHQKYSAMHPFL